MIEVESLKNVDAKFDIIITMPEGQTTKLVEQTLPFKLELFTTDFKCLVDATDYVLISLKDENGYVQANAKAAHLKSEKNVKEINGL